MPGKGAVGCCTCPLGDGEGIPEAHGGEMEDLMLPHVNIPIYHRL
jgi:hypothetical protein